MNIYDKFKGFLGKYADEIKGVGDALAAIVQHVPVGGKDKQKVVDTINAIDNTVDSVMDSLKGLADIDGETYTAEEIDAKIRAAEKRILAELDKRLGKTTAKKTTAKKTAAKKSS